MAKKEADSDRRKELDKDISSYIATRRKMDGGFLKSLSRMFQPSENVNVKLHPGVEQYGDEEKKKKEHHKEKHKKEDEEELEKEAEELEGEFEECAQPGLFTKVKNFFFEEEKPTMGTDIPPEEVERVIEENKKKEEAEEAQEEEDADTELEDEYEDGTKEKGSVKGFLSRLFGGGNEEGEEAYEEEHIEEDEVITDMKKIAEISTKAMKMLPPEKLKEFKESEDFKAFKDTLQKYGLIK